MKKRKLIATGGLMTALLLSGSHPALAETTPIQKVVKQTMSEEGFTPAQIHKVLTVSETSSKNIKNTKLSDEE